MGRLVPEALFSNELIEEHIVRAHRQVDVGHMPEGGNDVETPEECWERAAQRAKLVDPDGGRAYALLRRLQANYAT